MSTVGLKEIVTQRHVIQLFTNKLGYDYLGYWKDRAGNSNVEESLLTDWLKRQGHRDKIITKVLHELGKVRALSGSKTLYDANREVYGLLRYGVKVRPDVGEQNVTVWLIDWQDTNNNDFAIAEEVTVAGENDKRPDIVLYVNGIALGVLELKRSTVSVTEGIRDNPEAMAETIENNVRRLIIDEMAVNPKYYEKMSELLDALIQTRKQEAIDYKAYLAQIVELTKKASKPETQSSYPLRINSSALRALYDNLKDVEDLTDRVHHDDRVAESAEEVSEAVALSLDTAIRNVKKAGWRGNRFKEREVRIAIKSVLGDTGLVDAIFGLVKNQRDY